MSGIRGHFPPNPVEYQVHLPQGSRAKCLLSRLCNVLHILKRGEVCGIIVVEGEEPRLTDATSGTANSGSALDRCSGRTSVQTTHKWFQNVGVERYTVTANILAFLTQGTRSGSVVRATPD